MTGSVSSSFRQGIWMISFMAPGGVKATIAPVTRRLRAEGPALAVLGLMLVVGLVLRVLHNDHGLPYVFYVDEGSHFTKRAVEIFRDANPGYFQNPSAYTYLLHLTYRVIALPFGGGEKVISGYNASAAWIWEISRGLAAVLCLVGVAAIYGSAGQLWDRRTGLVAAAVLCFAFLPVAFSRLAVTDVGTLAPVAIVLLGAIRIAEGASWRWCLGAGLAAGLAIGFKYTAGLVLLAPGLAIVLAFAARARPARGGDRARRLVGGDAARRSSSPTRTSSWTSTPPCTSCAGRPSSAGNQDKFGQQGDSGPLLLPRQPRLGLRLRGRGSRRSRARCCSRGATAPGSRSC